MSADIASAHEDLPLPLRLSAALSVITIFQILSAFGIQWYTVVRLGVGVQTDALYAGATFPQIVVALLMEPLGFVLIPILCSKTEDDREGTALPLLYIIAAGSSLIAFVLFVLVPVIVPILAPGLPQSTTALTVQLAEIQLIGLIGVGCGTVLSCLSQVKGQFVSPALAVLAGTCAGWVLLMTGLDRWGVRLAAWAQVATVIIPAVLLLPVVRGANHGSLSDMRPLSRDVWSRMRPLVVSASYSRTSFVVDRFLTSLLAAGSISILDLVLRVCSAIVRVLNHGLVAPIVPQMARLAREQAWSSFHALWSQRVWWMGCLSGGVVLTMIVGMYVVFRLNVLDRLGDHGILQTTDFMQMWWVLLSCSGVILTSGINHILNNAFYAQNDMLTPSKIEVSTYTVGLIMKGIGVLVYGLIGVAIAISAYSLLTSVMLGTVLKRRARAQLRDNESTPKNALMHREVR